MPEPTYNTTETETKSEVSWAFFDEDVEEFQQPEIQEPLEFVEVDQSQESEEDQEETISPQRRRARANKNAKSFVNMGASGFASFAAVYAHAESEEFLIDDEDKQTIIDPLSDVLYENKSLDLPPGWALVIAILISFVPMIIKTIQFRRDHKALEEAKKKTIELEEKKEEKKDDKEEAKDE